MLLLIAMLSCTSASVDKGVVLLDDSGEGGGVEGGGVEGGGVEGGGVEGGGSEGGGSEGGVIDSGAPVEEVPGQVESDDGCPELYDPDVVQDFEIEISNAEWLGLENDYSYGSKSYHPITFRYEGEVVEDAMIRLKGNPSFSWFTQKMQFVIAFNEINPDGRFHGLRKLSLDASWYEPTFLRDRMSWTIMRRQGELPSICANSATLTVNGELYGLYTNIEYMDHEWLERAFGDEYATGTLWKYGYDPVSNADAATGDVDRISGTTDPDTLAGLGDLEEWTLEWAAEVALGDDDGYWCCDHNFYLYEHPERGVLFVPWDMDDNFDVQSYDVDPIAGYPNYSGLFYQSHYLALVRDETWGPVFLDQLESMNAAMDPAITLPELDAMAEQLADYVAADPNRSVGLEEHEGALERMRAWIPARHAFLKSWIACQRGEHTDADVDGYDVCDDPNDDDATVNPGATETCNGVDDDADGRIDELSSCDDCARHDVDGSHFLYCRNERTNTAAQSNCAAYGGSLSAPRTTGEYYLYFFYTWPVYESWWAGGTAGGGRCTTWEESAWSTGSATCTESHPSVCRIP